MAEPLLEMTGISKSFGGNRVLTKVDLDLWAGEVHAVVGENGAGKSTLMKILDGICPRDTGTIRMEGKEIELSNPHNARRAGISMVFQEHMLAPHLTVAQNIFLGMEITRRTGILREKEMVRLAGDLLRGHNFPLNAAAPVARLSRAEKQLVEIARALTGATRVVVMDEPTAMLSQKESDELFQIIRDLKKRGLAIVYISHRLEELPRIADRITILRDGHRVFTGNFDSVDPKTMIRYMVGREIRDLYPPAGKPSSEPALEVEGLGDGRQYLDISFTLHRGEIFGLAGLIGAGRTALARGIFGIDPPRLGRITIEGRSVAFGSAGEAVANGLGYLTEDRKITSIFPNMSLSQNISIAALDKIRSGLALNLTEEERLCLELIRRLDIRAGSHRDPIYRLSGGNQQKALLARWIFAGSKVLLLDEPTQGVDLGARAEIYNLMRDIASSGGAIVLISSDLIELLGMSHRIAVMRRGRIITTLDARQTNQEEIMRYAALIQ